MRRQFVAQVARFFWHHRLQLLVQQHDLLLQAVELLLLAKNRAIEFVDQVFRKTQFGFEFVDAGFRGLGWHARSG